MKKNIEKSNASFFFCEEYNKQQAIEVDFILRQNYRQDELYVLKTWKSGFFSFGRFKIEDGLILLLDER